MPSRSTDCPVIFYATFRRSTRNQSLDTVEQFFAGTKASIQHDGNRAFYKPPTGTSCRCRNCRSFRDGGKLLPPPLATKMTHWTRHKSRLNRDLGRKRFADAGYAMEETRCGNRCSFPLCRSWNYSRDPRRPRPPISPLGSKSSRTTSGPTSPPPAIRRRPPIISTAYSSQT